MKYFAILTMSAALVACGGSTGSTGTGGGGGSTTGGSGGGNVTGGSGGGATSGGSGGSAQAVCDAPVGGQGGAFRADQHPTLSAACDFGAANPTRLVVTGTDFSTTGVSLINIATKVVSKDITTESYGDAVPFQHDGDVYIVYRDGSFVDVLDGDDNLAKLGQYPIAVDGVAFANPQSLSFAANGMGYVPLLGAAEVVTLDFSLAPASAQTAGINICGYADSDGVPEASLSVACGDTVFVTAQRLTNFSPTGPELIVALDAATGTISGSAIELQGYWARQMRGAPGDATGKLAWVMTTGIEQVNLETGVVSWVVPEDLILEHASGDFNQFSSAGFAISADGNTVYLALTDAVEYTQVGVYQVDLTAETLSLEPVMMDGGEEDDIHLVIGTAYPGSLAVFGSELWAIDRTDANPGIRVLDVSTSPATAVAGPLDVGLAPYAMVEIP